MGEPMKTPNAWKVAQMVGVKEFNATIGPTGGANGYTAITGKKSR